MQRGEFLNILRSQLSGQMQEGKVAAHVRYYEDYIQSQVRGGRSEAEVLAELGDPRLIAKTLLDTDPNQGYIDEEEEVYSTYKDEEKYGDTGSVYKTKTHRLDLTTWYGKLIAILIAAIIVVFLVAVIGTVLPFFIILGVVLFIISRIQKR
jgi:uncharacterized membrane protein